VRETLREKGKLAEARRITFTSMMSVAEAVGFL
jgi:hypothetical protein